MIMLEIIVIVVVLIFVLYAIGEFISRVIHKKPFWPSLKKFAINIWDAISGIG